MKFNRIRFIILLCLSMFLMSFGVPKKLKKKVDKVIKKTFSVEEVALTPIEINEEIKSKLVSKFSSQTLFKIENKDQLIGYAYIDKAPSKTDEFDYLILLDKDLIIVKTKILIYREDYGGEIGSKRWLKQFIGKTSNHQLTYEKDIIAISGATISANSMTIAVNQFLQNLAVLHKNSVL